MAPPEGVYAYATRGYEKISVAGARHDYPSETFATVRRRPGCQWELEQRVIEEHVETHLFCGLPGVFRFLAETDRVSFFGQTNSRTYRCDPPEIVAQLGDDIGAHRQFSCQSDTGGHLDVTVTYLGRDPLVIDSGAIDALHMVIDGRISGDVQGTSRIEQWVHPVTGLMLRSLQHVKSSSHAFGTTVDYEEDDSFQLEHLAPAT